RKIMACVRRSRGGWVTDYRDAAGKRHIEMVESKSVGQEKLAEILRGLRAGTFNPARAKTVLKDYAVEWLNNRKSDIKRSTHRSYEYALRLHLLPDLGDIEIGKLTRARVRHLLAEKAEQKKPNSDKTLARDTLRIIKTTLHAMLESAVE